MTTLPSSKTVVGLFDSFDEARQTIEALVERGFRPDNISLLTPNHQESHDTETQRHVGEVDDTTSRTRSGLVGGGIAGGITGLLVGVGALAIPGIGPVIAAGPLTAVISTSVAGAGLGAAAGGIVGVLIDAGLPEQEASSFAEGVRRGGSLIIIQASGIMIDRAYETLREHGAVDMNQRTGQWRQSGWTAFDPQAGPF